MKRRVFVAASILLSIIQCDLRLSLHAQESAQAISKIREMGGKVVGLEYKPQPLFEYDGAVKPTPEIELISESFDNRSLQLLGALKPTFKNPPSNFSVDRFLSRNRTSLTLRNLSVTDEGIAYLASGKIKSLNFTSISLINAHVTDEAVLSLAKISSLRTLELSGCERLTDVRPLKELPNLSRLRLSNLPQLNAKMLKPLADAMNLNESFECSIDLSGCKVLNENLGTPIHHEIQEGKRRDADSKTGNPENSSDFEQILGTWKAEIKYSRGKSAKLLQYLTIQKGGQFQFYAKKKERGWSVWTEINPKHQVLLQGDSHVHHERKIYKYFIRKNDLVVIELAYFSNNYQPIPPTFTLSKQDLKRIDKVIINESLRDFSKNLSMDILPKLDFRTGSLNLESAEERPVTVTVYKREKPVSEEAKKK